MAEYLFMSGYGIYIWPAYGISFLILAGLMAYNYRRMNRLERRAAEMERHESQA